jgi:dimethylhistidine N-methyltransferase
MTYPTHANLAPAAADTSRRRFADDVRYYLSLSPRQLPSRYLYDALGSALFDAICELPWYMLTRSETRLLEVHGPAILAAVRPLARLIELGTGNGRKLETLLASVPRGRPADVQLVDVSPEALRTAAFALSGFHDVRVTLHEATYETGLDQVAASPLDGPARSLFLFLGSNIGNFDPPAADAFLRRVRAALRPGDGLLIGADLVKPGPQLQAAYDDPLGVTAAFNRNLLVRINRELDADFDLDAFVHRAVWNEAESRMEMHLVSTRPQRATVRAADLELGFEAGEIIWTESSYKYQREAFVGQLEAVGFRLRHQWIDDVARFALMLVLA